MSERGQRLGEMLRSAREARGLDRARAEEDTRIRERYLAAIERGQWHELPGEVYALGFVRSYARYLGIDPDTAGALYRLETGSPRGAGRRGPQTAPPGRRLASRPRPNAFVVSPAAVLAAFLTVLVGAMLAYIGYQVVTFARTPDLRVTDPPGDVLGHRLEWIVLSGVTAAEARVSVSGLPENPSVVADEEGRFSVRIELLPGSNLVTLSAFDPRTSRHSPEVTRRIEVVTATDGGESPGPSGWRVRPRPAAESAIAAESAT